MFSLWNVKSSSFGVFVSLFVHCVKLKTLVNLYLEAFRCLSISCVSDPVLCYMRKAGPVHQPLPFLPKNFCSKYDTEILCFPVFTRISFRVWRDKNGFLPSFSIYVSFIRFWKIKCYYSLQKNSLFNLIWM